MFLAIVGIGLVAAAIVFKDTDAAGALAGVSVMVLGLAGIDWGKGDLP